MVDQKDINIDLPDKSPIGDRIRELRAELATAKNDVEAARKNAEHWQHRFVAITNSSSAELAAERRRSAALAEALEDACHVMEVINAFLGDRSSSSQQCGRSAKAGRAALALNHTSGEALTVAQKVSKNVQD